MTTSIKATRPKKPNGWQLQTIRINKVRLRLSTRKSETDWDHFHLTMSEMVDTCRDPQLRARLDYLHKKVDTTSL